MGRTILNPWQKQRAANAWNSDGLLEWTEGGVAYLSVVFTWKLVEASQRIVWHRAMGREVVVGGPAVALMPNMLPADTRNGVNALQRHNPNATFTSRGCIRRCPFCAVPKTEGQLVELDEWEPKPLVCDNNLLACSQRHFDRVLDRLRPIGGVDFNQGLDTRLLTKDHATRLAELDLKWARLAWDDTDNEAYLVRAFELLRGAGIPKSRIGVYVLLGFNDTPEDALYRLETVYHKLGAIPFPMRYQPLDAIAKDAFVGPHWTDRELRRYVRYWANLRYLGSIPFREFVY